MYEVESRMSVIMLTRECSQRGQRQTCIHSIQFIFSSGWIFRTLPDTVSNRSQYFSSFMWSDWWKDPMRTRLIWNSGGEEEEEAKRRSSRRRTTGHKYLLLLFGKRHSHSSPKRHAIPRSQDVFMLML